MLRAGRTSLFIIDEGDIAKRVDVKTGAAEGPFIEVIGDVGAGDRVVIRGGERLQGGETLELLDRPEGSST